MTFPARFALALCCVVLSLAASGCASRHRLPASIVTLAVMDASMATGREETRRSETGWWFGATTRYDSGASGGVVLADALAEEFARIPGVQVMSRTDLRSYMAQKERLVYRQWPDLSPDERLKVLESQSPVDYGRSLNVDYVLTSRVYESRLVHHHFLHTWTARADFAVDLWDVRAGTAIWSWQGREADLFSSTTAVMERLSRRARERAQKADPFYLFGPVPRS